MEHIIQFGVAIDDDAIKKNIEKQATDKLVKDLKKDIETEVLGGRWSTGLSYKVDNVVREVVMQYTDEIIKSATDQLIETMKRSKKYKEALAKVVEVIDE